MKIAATLLLTGSALLLGGQAWDWSDETDFPEMEESKAICRALRDREPAAADRPNAAQARALRGCDSEALYYGIGRRADPVQARQCAFIEMESGEELVFGGRAMLMTIYANGAGAERDLDLATHLACGIEGAPAEVDGRVRRLAELNETDWTGNDFHFCDQVTSGLAGGHCAGHQARIAGARRQAALARRVAAWSPLQRRRLDPLQRAHQAYVEAHGGGEVDLSGTARAAIQIGAEEALRDELMAMLERLDAGRAPIHSRERLQAADRDLNLAYRAALRDTQGSCTGCVRPDGIIAAQRAWLRYRDAFLAFAAVRYPRVSRESLATWLTQQRTALLRQGEE